MADEIQSMVQIMELSVKGMTFGIKAGEKGIEVAKKLACLMLNLSKIVFRVDNEFGKTNIRNLKKQSKDFGGVVPLKLESKELQNEFIKKAQKAGILFSKGPDYKDGSFSVFVSLRDADLAKHIIDSMGKDKVKKAAKEQQEEFDQIFRENNHLSNLSEYVTSSGLADCPPDKFDQINREYFGEKYVSLEDLKKNAEISEELKNTLGKAVHESQLREDCLNKDFVKINFDNSMICRLPDEQNRSVQVAIPGTDTKVELPDTRILTDEKKEHYVFSQSKDVPLHIYESFQGMKIERDIDGHDFESEMQKKAEDIRKNKELLYDPNKYCVTLNCEKLVDDKAETEKAYKTRIPGTWGENEQTVWFDKNEAKKIHDGKSLFVILDKNKSYKTFDREGRPSMVSGEEMIKRYNDQTKKMNQGKKYSNSRQTSSNAKSRNNDAPRRRG